MFGENQFLNRWARSSFSLCCLCRKFQFGPNVRLILLVTVFYLTLLIPATAQNLKKLDDAWILYEKGRYLMDKGEWGDALHQLKLAIAKRVNEKQSASASSKTESDGELVKAIKVFPEAEMMIGDILKHSEPELARQQYELALQHAAFFYDKADVYPLLYKEADLFKNYFKPPRNKELENCLLAIVKESYTPLSKGDESYYESQFMRFQDLYLKVYLQKGLSKLLSLYRIKEQPMAQAHGELADLYYQQGGEKQILALKHYLFCLVIILTDSVNELVNWDFTFKYQDLFTFFKRTEKLDDFLLYFKNEELFKYFYRLAVASYTISQWVLPPQGWDFAAQQLAEKRAKEIWQWLAGLDMAEEYSELAGMQLKKPWVELEFTTDFGKL